MRDDYTGAPREAVLTDNRATEVKRAHRETALGLGAAGFMHEANLCVLCVLCGSV